MWFCNSNLPELLTYAFFVVNRKGLQYLLMCLVFFCYLFLFDYPLIQILINLLTVFFLGGAVNGEFHGVIFLKKFSLPS